MNHPPDDELNKIPTDSMDYLFVVHDQCYGRGCLDETFFSDCKTTCDRILLAGLDGLPDDPAKLKLRRWELTEEQEEYYKKFKGYAKYFFTWKIMVNDLQWGLPIPQASKSNAEYRLIMSPMRV